MSEPASKNEKFVLDARLEQMISISAFRAALQNGHEVVVYLSAEARKAGIQLNVGDMVQVMMSPYDMSRGEVVQDQEIKS